MTSSRHAGLVLAAGASSRMGSPKALLVTPAGIPLAKEQVQTLIAGGCSRAVIVLGSQWEIVKPQLSGIESIRNENWQDGRFSSVQTGLRVLSWADGVLILPVDTVGVKPATVAAILEFADERKPQAIRPTYGKRSGKVAWISKRLATELLAMDTAARLDEIVESRAVRLPVPDPAILNNVNTKDDWEKLNR